MGKQIVAAALILSASLCMLYWVAWNVSANVPPQDLIAFWAAAKLVHTDPYDKTLLKEVIPGCANSNCDTIRNPPWTLPFVAPLEKMDYRTAYAVSLVVNLVLVLGCAVALWHLYGGDSSPFPILLALSFGPTIWLIKIGQLSALPLLGVTLFSWAVRRKRYYAAGASLLLVSFKPHLVLPLLLVIFAWSLYQKKYAVIGGTSIAIGAFSLVAIALDRQVFSQYLTMLSTVSHEHPFFQSLGGWIEYVTGSRFLGLIPTVLGIGFAALWWWRRRRDWTPHEFVPVLLLISIATSYYAYLYDHVLLLLPIIVLLRNGRRRTWVLATGGIMNGIVWFSAVYGDRVGLPKTFPWWMAMGWLIVCLPLLFPALPIRTEASSQSPAIADI